MPECPCCFGDGGFDLRDSDALLEEMLTDEHLALVPNRGVKWWPCDECEETGVVSEGRLLEIAAVSKAAIDQFVARMRDEDQRRSG